MSERDSDVETEWQLLLMPLVALSYPPRDYPSLRRLVTTISDAEAASTLQKDCLVYYLLRDYRDGREGALVEQRAMVSRDYRVCLSIWAGALSHPPSYP